MGEDENEYTYFLTIYFKCSMKVMYNIEEHFGMKRGCTINGERTIQVNDLSELHMLEKKNYIEIRNKKNNMETTIQFKNFIARFISSECRRDEGFKVKYESDTSITIDRVCSYVLGEVSHTPNFRYSNLDIINIIRQYVLGK